MSTQESRAAPPSLFCRLPHEILQKIISYVAIFGPLEAKDLQETRYKHFVQLGNFEEYVHYQNRTETSLLWTYNQPHCPTLGSLQALAAVNKELNQLCIPVLWRALRFPTTLPAPMSAWDGLIEKYGSSVKSLELKLSEDWVAAPPEGGFYLGPRNPTTKKKAASLMLITERDNFLTSRFEDTEPPKPHRLDHMSRLGISRENVFRLLQQMPNLNALHLTYETKDQQTQLGHGPSLQHASRLQLNLTSLIAHTNGIRDFSIGSHLRFIPASCVINTIKQLPNLQSFRCEGVASDGPSSAEDFATALAGLKQLKKLSTEVCEVLDNSSQDRYPAAPNILELSVSTSSELRMSRAPSFISAWTPRLTHLTIQSLGGRPERFEFDPSLHQFNLPSLTHLSLEHEPAFVYLQCFQKCNNIRHLRYLGISKDAVSKVGDFISTHFSQLKSLITHPVNNHKGRYEPSEEEHRRYMKPLSILCEQNGIIIKFNS